MALIRGILTMEDGRDAWLPGETPVMFRVMMVRVGSAAVFGAPSRGQLQRCGADVSVKAS